MFIIIEYRNYFEFEYIIGRGGFSKVWQVKLKKNSKKYAIKEMSKVKIIDKKSEKSILGERDLLTKLKHPFIVNMICAFQDYENLYLLMDLLTGGDLRYHFNSNHIFSENEIRFFISCLILSLEYIHENNVIHRDVKPENLVYDEKGYVRLTDFGIAKIKNEENSSETSGTPGYMAPEVLLGENHSFTVDFYAIGVIGYEFLIGKRPYIGKNRKEIKHQILSKEAQIDQKNNNEEQLWSNECIDFINKCLKRKVANRLGYNLGVKELKAHPWLAKYDWINLYNKKMIAPYIPKNEINYDKKYCESLDKISNSTFERYKGYMRKNDYMKIFEGYTYFNNDFTQQTVENETFTRDSTSTKGTKQELLENQSYANIYPAINNEKFYAVTPLKNLVESSFSFNKGHNSVDHKLLLLERKKDENKNIENYLFQQSNNKINSRTMMKMEKNRRLLNKKQISVDILNINKEIREEINSRITENNQLNGNTKKDSFEFKNDLSSNLNLVDNNNISNINNIISNNVNDNNINNGINYNVNNNNITNKKNEYNIYSKIKNKNSFNSSLIEKQIEIKNDKFEKQINISVFNFKKFKKRKLNIHNLSSGLQTGESNTDEKKENKIIPIFLPPLNKNNNINNNKSSCNNSQNLPFLLSNIKQFKFKITKNKKIKKIIFNQNKIIENINKSTDEKQKPAIKLFSKFPQYIENDAININNEGKKSEIYKKLINNEKLKSLKMQLGKSQSTGLFPKIKIS